MSKAFDQHKRTSFRIENIATLAVVPPAEVEQLGVDDRDPGLARRLDEQSRDRVATVDQHRLRAAR